MTPAMISLRGVAKRFGRSASYAVKDFSLEVAPGELAVLVGPSGSGKTTVLRMINRLIEPTSGTIMVDGQDVLAMEPVALRRRIGYVIQSIGLMPHRSVADNIGMVPKLVGWDRDRIRARVAELAAVLELDAELLVRYPAELSGGQRQRVGVARALGIDPPVLLMDEPFGAVDPIVRARLQAQLLDLQDRLHKTIVLVTHDIGEAMHLGDRIAIINRGGALEQYAAPTELLAHPATPFVASFVGSERGLQRLGLMKVGGLATGTGPSVPAGATTADARAAMQAHGTDWVAVVAADGRLLGWADASGLDGQATAGDAPLHPFSAVVTPASTLREALDAVVTSRTHVAAVVEGGVYRGILTVEAISQELLPS